MVELDNGADIYEGEDKESRRRLEQRAKEKNINEAKEIGEAYGNAASEKAKIEADYIGRVRDATEKADITRIWHLLRVKGMNDIVMKAMEIVAEKEIEEINPVVAGFMLGEIDEEIGSRGIKLLGEHGRLQELSWHLWDDPERPVQEKLEKAAIAALEVVVKNKDELEYHNAEELVKDLLCIPYLGEELVRKAKGALSKIRNPLQGDGVVSEPSKNLKKGPAEDKKQPPKLRR